MYWKENYYFIKLYISKFNWLINCFQNHKKLDKCKLINVCATFLANINYKDINLSINERKTLNNILNKNYYYFDAYDNHEIEIASPVFSKDSVNIVFSTDKNYIAYLSVTISSIIENSSLDNNYDIIILYQDLYDYQKRFLLSLSNRKPNISIRFFNMKQYTQKFKLDELFTVNHITISAYFRLFVGKIFSAYKKILYLDCDLIAETDIAKLYYLNIGEYPVAAALDTTISHSLTTSGLDAAVWERFRKYMSETLNFNSQSKYFNSGVMIIDIEKFNEIDLDHLIDLAQRNNKFFHDQNVLNAAFEGNYFELPPTWNFQWNIKFHSTDYRYVLPSELLAFYEDPSVHANIIHYTSHEKPWKNLHHTFANIWWEYARKTPFYEILLKDLCKNGANQPIKQDLSINDIDLILYQRNKIRYWKYKILSKLVWGKKRKKYKEKKQLYKTKLKATKAYIKNIGRN